MALLLSIETSTVFSSVALHQDGVLLAIDINTQPQSAASQLAVMIQGLFKQTQIQPKELHAIVVTSGPGSYTGLRIGVATAKGLCYALNIPLIAINSLELMCHQVIEEKSDINYECLCPMLDARRMEVYCLLMNRNGQVIQPTQAKVIDHESFCDELLTHRIAFFGDGAEKCKTVMNAPNAIFIDNIFPSAKYLGSLAHSKWTNGQFENLGEFEPFYLKDFLIKKPNSIQ